MEVSPKTIERFSLYRRLLKRFDGEWISSRQLAKLAGVTAAQVRRDMMSLGCIGASAMGYLAAELRISIGEFLDVPGGTNVALVGAGELGRSILSFFAGRRKNLRIVATFETDPWLIDRKLRGCESYPVERMQEIIKEKEITLAIIATPVEAAQQTADMLVQAGIRGILNFAPVNLDVPNNVFVEDNDITTSLEKVAYFASSDIKSKVKQ